MLYHYNNQHRKNYRLGLYIEFLTELFEDVNINPSTESGPGSISPCSPYIGMNILSVDPTTVIVGDDQTNLIRVLEKQGFTVAPVKMRHAQTLSGGLHCTTLDLRRRGGLEDYT